MGAPPSAVSEGGGGGITRADGRRGRIKSCIARWTTRSTDPCDDLHKLFTTVLQKWNFSKLFNLCFTKVEFQ